MAICKGRIEGGPMSRAGWGSVGRNGGARTHDGQGDPQRNASIEDQTPANAGARHTRRRPVMTDLLIPLTDVEALKAAGIHYPATENAWRWCYRHRHARGLASAFKLNGRRIVVDVDAFKAAVRGGDVAMQALLER